MYPYQVPTIVFPDLRTARTKVVSGKHCGRDKISLLIENYSKNSTDEFSRTLQYLSRDIPEEQGSNWCFVRERMESDRSTLLGAHVCRVGIGNTLALPTQILFEKTDKLIFIFTGCSILCEYSPVLQRFNNYFH